jgi:hypothetical protein
MLHAYVKRFDVTGNLENFYKILGTKHDLSNKRFLLYFSFNSPTPFTII